MSELASEEVAILPGNPFHFVIGIKANLKGLFVSNAFEEAQLKLEVAGRRAGEVRKLLDWASDNEELLSLALTNYRSALSVFEEKLRAVAVADLGDDAEESLAKMTRHLLTQLRFVDDVRSHFVNEADAEVLAEIDEALVSSFRFVGTKLDTPSDFADRIASFISGESDAATAIRTIGVLAGVIRDVAGTDGMNDFVAAIAKARDMLIADLAAAIRSESSIAVFAKVSDEAQAPSVSEIVDLLADETLKAELALLL